jgi:mannose/fructose/N-acetylgalactosamine-specific phosphotransferase system component IIC
MGLGIGLGHANFARFPAIRAVVFAIHAESDIMQTLAVAAIAVALAFLFRQVALRTENCGLHILLRLCARHEELPRRKALWKTL